MANSGHSENHSNKEEIYSSDSINQVSEHRVYWLDENHNNPLHNYNIEPAKLRGIIDYLECFTKIDICVENIKKINNQKLFIIISSSCYLELLTQMHDFCQVHAIYIYQNSTNSENQSGLSDSNMLGTYKKVVAVHEHLNELLGQLSQDIRVFLRQRTSIDSAMPFTALQLNEERTTGLHSRVNESWFPYLIDAFQEVPPVSNGKEKFVVECRNLYENNSSVLNFINEFDNTYAPETAISWYTREGILYQLFNRTLRQLDQDRIFRFHFFIYDLSQQLKNELEKNKNADWRKEPLYRGQRISKTELESLKEYKTVYVNTFLSTTRNLTLAKIYAGVGSFASDSESSEQPVIFKIGGLEWDPAEKSVADIDHLSHFGGAEGEILFAPTYTFWPLNVEYDTSEAVWNITLCRYTESYDLRHEYLTSLIKLDVILRTIIEEKPSTDNAIKNEFILKNVTLLIHELKFEHDDIVTLNRNIIEGENTDTSQFELKAIRLFANTPHPQIKSVLSPITISILYDCLATVYKCIEKYDLATEHYTKAANYIANENSISSTMRKVKIAQIHKITGHYALAWKIFQEIATDDTSAGFSYERIFTDIIMNEPPSEDENIQCKNYRNCYQYLDYVRSKAELTIYGSIITDCYHQIAEAFLQYDDQEQAIECFKREIQVHKRIIRHNKVDRLELAFAYMSLAELYQQKTPAMAIKAYQDAITHFNDFKNIGENIHMAICWCEIGSLKSKHQTKPFLCAFDLLLLNDGDQLTPFIGENIARCYLCLAKSYARCNKLSSLASESSQLSLRFFLNNISDRQALLEDDLYGCWDLILSLYQIKHDKDGSHAPTKEELYEMWKPSTEHPALDDEEIIVILEKTREQLQQQAGCFGKCRRSGRNRTQSVSTTSRE